MDIEKQSRYTQEIKPPPPFPNIGRITITNESERDHNLIDQITEQFLPRLETEEIAWDFVTTARGINIWISAKTQSQVDNSLDRVLTTMNEHAPNFGAIIHLKPETSQ